MKNYKKNIQQLRSNNWREKSTLGSILKNIFLLTLIILISLYILG